MKLSFLTVLFAWLCAFVSYAQDDLQDTKSLDEVVVTGTIRGVRRSESPVPVEIISQKLFKKNPSVNLFSAMSMVNGVRPQINCGVCYTTDIRINGIEGYYTLVLIDGMPIVSSLSTVYGFNGIPNSMIEQVEIVKGPASSLYGSEAMAGVINIVTKKVDKSPRFSVGILSNTWLEENLDLGTSFRVGKTQSLLGLNYYNFQKKIDNNNDGFVDMPLQNRISIFNKWTIDRPNKKQASLAVRYLYEDRAGGQINWNKSYRGGDVIYGESIFTSRVEAIGTYQLPAKEQVFAQFSYNYHDQNAAYGDTFYLANQQVAYGQLYWTKKVKSQQFLTGVTMRYNVYDDNTPATLSKDGKVNNPINTTLPGFFVQDEISLGKKSVLLAGFRYDYNEKHGGISSPRIAYKFSPSGRQTLRASFGSGFRIVNLFTENHAALNGARELIIKEALNPERSYNGNLNYTHEVILDSANINFDLTGFYAHFSNKIIPDYNQPNAIIYSNLKGFAVSRGVSFNTEIVFDFPLRFSAGASYMDVYRNEEGYNERLWFAPEWSGTFVASYELIHDLTLDLTGNWNGSMRLPIQKNDFRPEYSTWFTVANLQLSKLFHNGLNISLGVKNLFNFIPSNPILRPFDPFNKSVNDQNTNPNNYTFDTFYTYASLQGARAYINLTYELF